MEFGVMLDRCPGKMTVFWILEVDKYSMKNTIWYVNSLGIFPFIVFGASNLIFNANVYSFKLDVKEILEFYWPWTSF